MPRDWDSLTGFVTPPPEPIVQTAADVKNAQERLSAVDQPGYLAVPRATDQTAVVPGQDGQDSTQALDFFNRHPAFGEFMDLVRKGFIRL